MARVITRGLLVVVVFDVSKHFNTIQTIQEYCLGLYKLLPLAISISISISCSH